MTKGMCERFDASPSKGYGKSDKYEVDTAFLFCVVERRVLMAVSCFLGG